MKKDSPFKFLDAYTLGDKDAFFGREEEVNQLYDMVFKTNLVLIYGLSGTGKTSLVQCGLASRFDGVDWLPLFIRRQSNINTTLIDTLDRYLDMVSSKKEGNIQSPGKQSSLNDSILKKTYQLTLKYLRPVYLIFDQLEELFILGDETEQQQFAANIAQLLSTKIACKVVFIIREEYLGQLYEFEKYIPYIFDFRMRLEKMNREKTKMVIEKSFNQFGVQIEGEDDEEKAELLSKMIDNISEKKAGVPLPYLQVYMDRLYRNKYDIEGDENIDAILTEEDITAVGEIENVLEDFLVEQKIALQNALSSQFEIDREDMADLILDTLVTKEGTRNPIAFIRKGQELSLDPQMSGLIPEISSAALIFAFTFLEDARIIRVTDYETYEIAHDSLAQIINEKRTDEQRERRNTYQSLMIQFAEYSTPDDYLSEKRINRYEPYLEDLELEPTVLQFIKESRAYNKQKEVEEERQREEIIRLEEAEKRAAIKLKNEREIAANRAKEAEDKRKRIQWSLIVAIITGIVLGVIAIFAFDQQREAEQQEKEAKKQTKIAETRKDSIQLARDSLFESTYQLDIASSYTFAATGNYSEAADQLSKAILLAEKNEIEIADSLRQKVTAWEAISEILKDVPRLEKAPPSADGSHLLHLLDLYLWAEKEEQSTFLTEKIRSLEDRIEDLRKAWLIRSKGLRNIETHGSEASNVVRILSGKSNAQIHEN